MGQGRTPPLSQSRALGVGRSLLALAQLSVLLGTPSRSLFVPVGGALPGRECGSGLPSASAYCVIPQNHQVVSLILAAGLLCVLIGIWPRVTSWLHAWIAFSLHQNLSLPDGGEAVAQVTTLFIALICLADSRRWHWSPPTRSSQIPGAVQGHLLAVGWAASVGLTLQMAYVYLNSSIAKISVEQWREGSAIYYVARMESFGAAGLFWEQILTLTRQPAVALGLTWGAITLEILLGVLIVAARRLPVAARAAVLLCTALHVGIIVQLGIVSFGLVMIGAVVCAVSPGLTTSGRPAHRPDRTYDGTRGEVDQAPQPAAAQESH